MSLACLSHANHAYGRVRLTRLTREAPEEIRTIRDAEGVAKGVAKGVAESSGPAEASKRSESEKDHGQPGARGAGDAV